MFTEIDDNETTSFHGPFKIIIVTCETLETL